MSRLEFPLAQGWSLGLNMVFENAADSSALDLSKFFHVEQVHGAAIHTLSPSDINRTGPLAKADGLYAQGDWIKKAGRAMLIKTADCVPLFYVDRQSEAICAIHAGWRGLQQGIHRQPFQKKWFDPKFTWVWMGPCLNAKNFEVGPDMWQQFSKAQQQDPRFFEAVPGSSDKKYFNTWAFVDAELRGLGVDLIYNVEVDTYEDPSFASYRRARKGGLEKSDGRNYSWMGFEKLK